MAHEIIVRRIVVPRSLLAGRAGKGRNLDTHHESLSRQALLAMAREIQVYHDAP
jgi:hypothetical protein